MKNNMHINNLDEVLNKSISFHLTVNRNLRVYSNYKHFSDATH